ncbi:hypothetical protein CCACVL1_11309 [Corchorus capsularis]|uniref:Uncharacterized protein n=1 Tax=Corchorus capsularis TaxID=210143 RepID=A0A1R3IM27_COCAP|nr:hypothetical protein CCACVL1_11309 [Corchorus capsularis]
MALSSILFLNNCGKNNQTPVNPTNAKANGPETARCNRHLTGTAFFTTTSTATATPCRTKNHVTSHVGYTRVM